MCSAAHRVAYKIYLHALTQLFFQLHIHIFCKFFQRFFICFYHLVCLMISLFHSFFAHSIYRHGLCAHLGILASLATLSCQHFLLLFNSHLFLLLLLLRSAFVGVVAAYALFLRALWLILWAHFAVVIIVVVIAVNCLFLAYLRRLQSPPTGQSTNEGQLEASQFTYTSLCVCLYGICMRTLVRLQVCSMCMCVCVGVLVRWFGRLDVCLFRHLRNSAFSCGSVYGCTYVLAMSISTSDIEWHCITTSMLRALRGPTFNVLYSLYIFVYNFTI